VVARQHGHGGACLLALRGVRVVMATAERTSWRCSACASSWPRLGACPGAARRAGRDGHDGARLLALRGVLVFMPRLGVCADAPRRACRHGLCESRPLLLRARRHVHGVASILALRGVRVGGGAGAAIHIQRVPHRPIVQRAKRVGSEAKLHRVHHG
jgi:hypothetical protein